MAPSDLLPTAKEVLAQLVVRVAQLEGENGVIQTLINTIGIGDGGKAKIDPPTKYGGDKDGLTGFLT